MRRWDPTEFRNRFEAYKQGKKPYQAGRPITDDEYFDTMEKVAIENNAEWNRLRREEGLREMSVDEEVMRVLNDHTYDYRGYYNKYPQNSANAKTHWTDEFKTYLHPTFSDQSRYAPNNPNYVGKTKYNPKEIKGGHWFGEIFIPSYDQLTLPHYQDGKTGKTPGYTPYQLSGLKQMMVVPTGQCAEWANRTLANMGYNAYGHAWTQGGDIVFNGWDGKNNFGPSFTEEQYDKLATAAADSLFHNFKSDEQLDTAQVYVTNMYYPESKSKEKAAKEGKRIYGTHTGILKYNQPEKKWQVFHNIGNGQDESKGGHGNIYIEDWKQMQAPGSQHRPIAVIKPSKHGILSKTRRAIRNILGFADGKSPYDDYLKQEWQFGLAPWMIGGTALYGTSKEKKKVNPVQ